MKMKPRVLIAEREGIIEADLKSMFKSWGFDTPAVAKTEDNILKMALEFDCDVVVLDENLQAVPNFLTTIRRLIKESHSIVVFLSDYLNSRIPEPIMSNKSFYHLPKPFNSNELQCIVESSMHHDTMEEVSSIV